MLVKTSIMIPLIDQFVLRTLKYTAIKTTNAKKQRLPSNTLAGYLIGYFEISPKATVTNQIHAHTSPAAPTADNPTERTVVFMLQLFLTVLENIKQNNAVTINVIPNKIATNGQPSMMRKTTNSYVGASAPPMIPTALF